MSNFKFQPFQVESFLDAVIAAIDWDSVYKLFLVLLDATRCFLVMKSPCKRYIDLICHLVLSSVLHYGPHYHQPIIMYMKIMLTSKFVLCFMFLVLIQCFSGLEPGCTACFNAIDLFFFLLCTCTSSLMPKASNVSPSAHKAAMALIVGGVSLRHVSPPPERTVVEEAIVDVASEMRVRVRNQKKKEVSDSI